MSPRKAPKSVRRDHDEIREFLAPLTRQEGPSGEAARRLARVLESHFRREEAFAAPPLGLLPALARGQLSEDMGSAVTHSEWLKQNLETMLAEHRMIAAAIETLLQASDNDSDLVSFAEKLLNHARMEEEVFYPAAIVVGEYLKLRLGRTAALAG
jgi:hypothetical protein